MASFRDLLLPLAEADSNKTISKIHDSYRVSDKMKLEAKKLRVRQWQRFRNFTFKIALNFNF